MHTPHIRPPISNRNLSRLNPLLLPLPWIIVIVLCVLFGAINFSGKDETDNNQQSETKIFPQFYLTDVELHEFDDQGALHYQVKTPLVRHFQMEEKQTARDYTLFTTPHIIFAAKADKPEWDISADEGRSSNNGDLFTLNNHVVAAQESETQGLMTINTSELQVNTREQFAETDKAVTMRSAKTQLDTVGIHADIKLNQIKFLSNVKGSYEP